MHLSFAVLLSCIPLDLFQSQSPLNLWWQKRFPPMFILIFLAVIKSMQSVYLWSFPVTFWGD